MSISVRGEEVPVKEGTPLCVEGIYINKDTQNVKLSVLYSIDGMIDTTMVSYNSRYFTLKDKNESKILPFEVSLNTLSVKKESGEITISGFENIEDFTIVKSNRNVLYLVNRIEGFSPTTETLLNMHKTLGDFQLKFDLLTEFSESTSSGRRSFYGYKTELEFKVKPDKGSFNLDQFIASLG